MYDGQHRIMLCKFFAEGHYKPSYQIKANEPTVFYTFQSAKATKDVLPVKEGFDCTFEDMELFKEQKLILGCSSNDNFEQVLDHYVSTGRYATESATLVVERTWATFMTEFAEYLRGVFFTAIPPLGINFWQQPNSTTVSACKTSFNNHSDAWVTHFFALAYPSYESLMNEGLGQSQKKIEAMKDRIRRSMQELLFPMSGKKDGLKMNDVPLKQATIVTLLKLLLHNPNNTQLIYRYFSGHFADAKSAKRDNYKFSTDYVRDLFTKPVWMKNNILWPLRAAVTHIDAIVTMELKVLQYVATPPNDFTADMEKQMGLCIKKCVQEGTTANTTFDFLSELVTLPDITRCKLNTVRLQQYQPVKNKIMYSIYATLLRDMLEFILDYGPNPIIYSSKDSRCGPHKNRAVRLYCR